MALQHLALARAAADVRAARVRDLRARPRASGASQQLNPSYGYLWWLNGHEGLRANGTTFQNLAPSAPDDMVAALGALGRKVYVVRSRRLVVTRTGDNADQKGEQPFDEAFWKALFRK